MCVVFKLKEEFSVSGTPVAVLQRDNSIAVGTDSGFISFFSFDDMVFFTEPVSGSVVDASYHNKKWAFLTTKIIYVFGEVDTIFPVPVSNPKSIAVTDEGVVVCGDKCKMIDFNGKEKWEVELSGKVTYGAEHIFIADSKSIFVLNKDGVIKYEQELDGKIKTIATCNNRLFAVLSSSGVMFDISNPTNLRKLWKQELWKTDDHVQARFLPNCENVLIAGSVPNCGIAIVGKERTNVIEFKKCVVSADWNEYLAVGFENGLFGSVKIYQIVLGSFL